MKIGLVEDSPALSNFFRSGLEANGHTVTLYESEQDAVQEILNARFQDEMPGIDLLIIDVGISQGFKTIRRLRQFVPESILSIIIVSSFASHFDLTVLEKPVSLSTLLETIKSKEALKT